MKQFQAVALQLNDILMPLLNHKTRYFMKISTVMMGCILLVTQMLCAAPGKAQDMSTKKITLSVGKESLRDALNKVEQLSGFRIAYPPEVVTRFKTVSLSKGTRTVKETISLLLQNTRLQFRQQEEIIVIYQQGEAAEADTSTAKPQTAAPQAARDRTIIGSVIEARTNVPLPGVTVMIKNTNKGTQTQVDGTYSLVVPSGYNTLVFSYIGYEPKEVEMTSSNQYHVQLSAGSSGLQEVVVVAYGEQKKATVTGSIASIGTKELQQSPVSNLTNALAGRLPGLITTQRSGEPGVDASTLYIRGIGTLSAGLATPIFMVDGVERSIDYVDPNDIESFTILKDAAATAVLGMRGANGAVLITTRRGKSGAPQVSFRASAGMQEATRLPEYLGSYDYARLLNEALVNDNAQPAFTQQQLDDYKAGIGPNTDYYKFIMRSSHIGQANLNVSGGGNVARYFISAGYNIAEGNYKFTKNNPTGYDGNNIMKRYNLRANVDVDITPTLTARLDLAGILTDRTDGNNSASTIMNLANRMAPIYPIFNENGSMWGNGTFQSNIYGELSQKGYRKWYNSTTQGTFALTRKLDFITKNLTAKVSFSYDNQNTPNSSYTRNYAVFEPVKNSQGQITSYKQYGNDTRVDPNGSFSGGGFVRQTYFEATGNWNRSFGKHNASAMILWNRRLASNGSSIPSAYQSLLFRGTYNYREKYMLELSASYQGSENFPKESRYGFFPSISGGWLISEEPFIKDNIGFVKALKLRASYGEVGNDRSNSGRFLWFTSWQGADPYWFGTNVTQANGWGQGAIGNPGVTWERGKQIDLGVDMDLWNGKFQLTFDYFSQKRRDILISRNTLSDVFGQSIKAQNIGAVDNRGFEFEIKHLNRFGKFFYEISPNFTWARNKIVYMDEVARTYPWMRRTGWPVDTKFGLIADGFFQDAADVSGSPFQNFSAYGPGDIKYKKLTGKEYDYVQATFDETRIGYSRTPEIIYGANIRGGYGNFDFSILFQGAARSDVLLNNEAVYEFFQSGKVKPFHLGRWTPETASTATYPRLHSITNGNNHRASTFWIRSADYTRIKNAEIGYTLPKKLIAKVGLTYFRVYLQGMNLYTWDKLKDFQVDPEIGDGNGAMYPIQKNWNFGIDVKF